MFWISDVSLICTSQRNKGGLGLEVPVFTCTFTVLTVSVSIKAILDRARLTAATPGQLRREGILTDWKEPKHNSKFISEFYIFLSQRNLFELLYSVNSQANLPWPCMGGMCNPAPTDLQELHPSSAQKSLWLQPWERITWLDQFSSSWKDALHSTVHLYLKSAWVSLAFCNLKPVQSTAGRQTDAPETPNHHHNQKSEPTSVCTHHSHVNLMTSIMITVPEVSLPSLVQCFTWI